MLSSVRHLAERGFAIHWLRPRSKAPISEAWSTAPVVGVDRLQASYRDGYNVGVRLGEPSKVGGLYLHVIDLDVRDPKCIDEARAELLRLLPGAYQLPTVASGAGGASRHFYFLTDRPFRSKKVAHSREKFLGADGRKHWTWEIELFGSGKQVAMPPSIHPDTGRAYAWERDFDWDEVDLGLGPVVAAATIEAWGIRTADTLAIDDDDLLAHTRQKPLGLTDEEIRGYLKDLPLDTWCEDRDGWYQTGMALHHETEGAERGFALWCEFSKQSEKFDAKDSQRVWKSFKGVPKPVRMPTLIKAAGLARLEAAHAGDEDDDEDLIGGGDDVDSIDAIGTDRAEPRELNWKSKLAFNEDGSSIKGTMPNLALILANDERLAGLARFNEFTQEVVVRDQPGRKPGKTPKGILQLDSRIWAGVDPINGTLWSDSMDNAVRQIIEAPKRQGGYDIKVTDRDLKAAVDLAAQRNAFHPIREYLETLTWDGVPRAESLFVDYLDAEDNAYHRQAASMFLIAAVCRIYEPGHKFDFAPILEGLQGKRKSTFIGVLARHWSGELDCDFHDTKQIVEATQGTWIPEIPELSGFGRADIRTIKAVMSRQTDKTRLSYARRAQPYPRQCVFMGSTNDREYLRDDTGGRRFWPIECRLEGEIDIDRLQVNVDQIWAEALHLYRAMRKSKPYGILPLYLTDAAAQRVALFLQEDRRVETAEDAMIGQIEAWLDKPMREDFEDEDDLIGQGPRRRDATCLLQIWVECLGNDRRGYNFQAANVIGKAMRRVEGWRLIGLEYTEKYGRQRVYRRDGTVFGKA